MFPVCARLQSLPCRYTSRPSSPSISVPHHCLLQEISPEPPVPHPVGWAGGGHLSCIPDSLPFSFIRTWCLGHLLRPEGGCLVAQIGEVTQLNETLWALRGPNILPTSQTPPERQARHHVCSELGTKWTGSNKGTCLWSHLAKVRSTAVQGETVVPDPV